MNRRIYLAGPMRGQPQLNVPAFEAAARNFRHLWWTVVSPVDVGRLFDNDPNISPAAYLREDLLHLARCSAIAMLPGWEASVGARCEVAVAITLGLTFYYPQPDGSWQQGPAPARVTISGGYERPPGAVAELVADGAA